MCLAARRRLPCAQFVVYIIYQRWSNMMPGMKIKLPNSDELVWSLMCLWFYQMFDRYLWHIINYSVFVFDSNWERKYLWFYQFRNCVQWGPWSWFHGRHHDFWINTLSLALTMIETEFKWNLSLSLSIYKLCKVSVIVMVSLPPTFVTDHSLVLLRYFFVGMCGQWHRDLAMIVMAHVRCLDHVFFFKLATYHCIK